MISSESSRAVSMPLPARYSAVALSTSPSVNPVLSSTGAALERPALGLGGEGVGELAEVAREHVLEARVHPDPVVGDAVLREVVGADLLGPLTPADLGAPRRRLLGCEALALGLVEARAQHAHRLGLVLELRALVLHRDDDPRRA